MWLWILLALIAAIIYLVLTSYNSLQRKAHDIKESLSNISVSIKLSLKSKHVFFSELV